jgi:hypothetical protein
MIASSMHLAVTSLSRCRSGSQAKLNHVVEGLSGAGDILRSIFIHLEAAASSWQVTCTIATRSFAHRFGRCRPTPSQRTKPSREKQPDCYSRVRTSEIKPGHPVECRHRLGRLFKYYRCRHVNILTIGPRAHRQTQKVVTSLQNKSQLQRQNAS